jgi:hypothetical protein
MSLTLFVRASVGKQQLGSHWTGFYEIWYFIIFRKAAEKIQERLKYDKYNEYLHEDLCAFMVIYD